MKRRRENKEQRKIKQDTQQTIINQGVKKYIYHERIKKDEGKISTQENKEEPEKKGNEWNER